jgi:hypothetical protein
LTTPDTCGFWAKLVIRVKQVLPDLHTYSVQKRAKQPLLQFLLDGLNSAECRILFASSADCAPLVVTFETSSGERIGIVAYAFLATRTPTKKRPADERSFQIKYSDKDEYRSSNLHEIWQDRFNLFTTLFLGIDPKEGFFVAADPVLHNPTKFFIRLEFKDRQAEEIKRFGWYVWRRERRPTAASSEKFEVLIGGTRERVLDLIRLERAAKGLQQLERESLAKEK